MRFLEFLLIIFILLLGSDSMAEENTKMTLTKRQENIVMISSYTAVGDLKNLEASIKNGLNDGLTVNEIKEILIQMYAYVGFPRSLNALATLLKVTKKGNYKEGEVGKPLPKKSDLNKIGTETQAKLVGAKVQGELFKFAPAIDDYLKEHLFGDIFARGVLSWQEREIATIAALSSIDGVEPQLDAHIQIGIHNGLTDKQVIQILILTSRSKVNMFPIGEPNTAYAKYFIGQSYLAPISTSQVKIFNVTFEPRCRNNWHIHKAKSGGGQMLIAVGGRGYYQEWGKEPVEMKKGDVINIPANVKHWHGAAPDSWFSHLAIEVDGEETSNEWLEAVDDKEYNKLK